MESFHMDSQTSGTPKQRRSTADTAAQRRSTVGISKRLSVASCKGHTFTASASEEHEGLTFIEVVMNFAIACIGGGVVVFPKTMSNTGYIITPFLTMFAAALCCECGVLICKSCDAAERLTGQAPGSIADYEALADAIGGPPCKRLLMFSKNCAFVSFVIVFIVFITDGIANFFPGTVEAGKQIVGDEKDENDGKPILLIRFCIVLPMFMLLAMIKDLKQLANFALVGVGAVAVQCLCIIINSVQHFNNSESCRAEMVRDKWGNKVESWIPLPGCVWYEPMLRYPKENGEIPKSIAVFIFGFAIIGTLPSVRSQMAEPAKLPKALAISFVIILVAYMCVMGSGYLGFGETVSDNVIKSMDGPILAGGASVSIIVNLALSAPIFMICVYNTFEASGDDALRTPFTVLNIGFRMVSVAVLTTIAHCLPYVMQIIGIASSIFCVCNNLIIPLTIYYMASSQEKSSGRSIPSGGALGMLRVVFHGLIMVVALMVLVLGTIASWETLMEKMSKGKIEIKRAPEQGQLEIEA